MKIKILLLALFLPLVAFAQTYVSTNPPATSSQMTLVVTSTGLTGAEGLYTNSFNGTNWPADSFTQVQFSGHPCSLTWGGTNSNWVIYYSYLEYWVKTNNSLPLQPQGNYYPGVSGMPNYYLIVSTYVPPPMVLQSNTYVNFVATNGGTLTLSARAISVNTNEAFIILAGTNVLYESAPTLVAGGLLKLNGQLMLDASNNLNTFFSVSGAGLNDSAFMQVTNFTGTNFSLTIAADATLDTNLVLTAMSLTAQQAVGATQPSYFWPPLFTGTKTIYTVNSTNTAVITNTITVSNGLITTWSP